MGVIASWWNNAVTAVKEEFDAMNKAREAGDYLGGLRHMANMFLRPIGIDIVGEEERAKEQSAQAESSVETNSSPAMKTDAEIKALKKDVYVQEWIVKSRSIESSDASALTDKNTGILIDYDTAYIEKIVNTDFTGIAEEDLPAKYAEIEAEVRKGFDKETLDAALNDKFAVDFVSNYFNNVKDLSDSDKLEAFKAMQSVKNDIKTYAYNVNNLMNEDGSIKSGTAMTEMDKSAGAKLSKSYAKYKEYAETGENAAAHTSVELSDKAEKDVSIKDDAIHKHLQAYAGEYTNLCINKNAGIIIDYCAEYTKSAAQYADLTDEVKDEIIKETMNKFNIKELQTALADSQTRDALLGMVRGYEGDMNTLSEFFNNLKSVKDDVQNYGSNINNLIDDNGNVLNSNAFENMTKGMKQTFENKKQNVENSLNSIIEQSNESETSNDFAEIIKKAASYEAPSVQRTYSAPTTSNDNDMEFDNI